MTGEQLLFWLFGGLACAGALAVVISQNVVRMAVYLIVSLGSAAGLFFLASADFVGATQLLVYVGGTIVLLIFGVMLTASGPYLRIRTSPAEGFLAGGVGLLFLAMLFATVLGVKWNSLPTHRDQAALANDASDKGSTLRPIGFAFAGLRPDRDLGAAADGNSSRPISTGYLLPFEIVSVHLLVVLIGAAYLARAKRRARTGESLPA